MKLVEDPAREFSQPSRVCFWSESRSLWRSFASTPIHSHPPSHRCEKPLLLLYGFLATPRVVGILARRLHGAGYCVFSLDLGGLFGCFNSLRIDDVAGLVAAQMGSLSRRHGFGEIDVVGHSEGGLIGRYYVQKLGGTRLVRHLVTLATPHQGTYWAYLGFPLRRITPSLAQMAPGSSLIRQLNDGTFPPATRLTSVYSRADLLCPPSSCHLDDRVAVHFKNVEIPRGGHNDFLFRKSSFAVLREELRSANVEAPRLPPSRRMAGSKSERPGAITRPARGEGGSVLREPRSSSRGFL